MIVVGTSIMLRYKKTICPIHHQTEHINSGLLYKEREFRRHKDNMKSGHIYRRRTFSPTETYPVRQMMDIQVVWGIKSAEIYIFSLKNNIVYYKIHIFASIIIYIDVNDNKS